MAEVNGRFEWVGKLARIALIAVITLLGLMVVATVAQMVIIIPDLPSWTEIAPWVLMILGELVAVILAFVLYGLAKAVLLNESGVSSSADRLRRLETLLADQVQTARRLVDMASLSDRAKSLIYREREIDALRETVYHEIMRQDYETAEALIESLEKELGYAKEAERLREALKSGRQGTLEEKIDAAVNRIQKIIDVRDWSRAGRESKRVMKLFPNNPKVTNLPQRIEDARTLLRDGIEQARTQGDSHAAGEMSEFLQSLGRHG